MEQEQAKFEGWAVVELFGHSREAGYVSTEYFGGGALFRVEVPALEEREVTLTRPEWVGNQLAGVGSKLLRGAVQGRTRFIGVSAVYAMNPCTKEAVLKAIEAMADRHVKVIELVGQPALVGATLPGEENDGYDGNESDEDEGYQ